MLNHKMNNNGFRATFNTDRTKTSVESKRTRDLCRICKSSRLQIIFKMGDFKNVANFTEIHVSDSLFIKVAEHHFFSSGGTSEFLENKYEKNQ